MSTYSYELPTTGAISFADFCVDQTASNLYTTHISDATQARANVRSELKENKRTDHVEKDYLKLIKVCTSKSSKIMSPPELLIKRVLEDAGVLIPG